MSRMSPNRNSAVVVLLCIGAVAAACGEPQCPRSHVKRGDTCYRKDGGAQSTDSVEGEDAAIAAGDEAGSADVSVDAGPEPGPRDEPDALVADTGMPAVDAAPPDAAPPFDGGAGSDAANTGPVTCASQPCQNGGSCTDEASGVRCSCAEPFMGERCELEICGPTTIQTQADLDAARLCREIRGNLQIFGGATEITAQDLPNLTKVTGDLVFSARQAPAIERMTLGALQAVEGELQIVATTARVLTFPALTTIGTSDGAGRLAVNAALSLGRLEMPALTTIYGDVQIQVGHALCTANFRKVTRVTGTTTLSGIPYTGYSSFQRLVESAEEASTIVSVGCCILNDSSGCEEWLSGCRPLQCP